MIFVVEVPHVGDAHAWFAFDGEDLLNKVEVNDPLKPWEIYDVATARELFEMVGEAAESAQARAAFPGIASLGDEYGLDTPLYRADHVLERGAYQPEAVALTAACEGALKARVSSDAQDGTLKDLRIYWSEADAVLGSEADDPLFKAHGGWRALHALREQLLSLDVVAEN